jgi:hypothetical protein
MFSRSIVELGWPPHISTILSHICTSWFDCMTQLSSDPSFDFTIYALQVYPNFLPTYELHINLSGRKRKRHNIFITLVRIHKYHIYWETWKYHTKKSLSFILKTYKNFKTMMEQRTWDIVLDLIVLSFNCSRPKWRLRSPWLKVIWVNLKVRSVYSNPEENS